MENKLRQMSLDRLLEIYFNFYSYDKRIKPLLELLGEDKAKEWLISEFNRDYRPAEISELIYQSSTLL